VALLPLYRNFLNSLIIHQVLRSKIVTVMVSRYLMLITIDFYDFNFSVFSSVLVSIEN